MTQTNDYPKLCVECKSSLREQSSTWEGRCFHPKVVSKDARAIATTDLLDKPPGVSCFDERNKRSWFAKCGMKGKLFEHKRPTVAICGDSAINLGTMMVNKPKILDTKMIEMRWLITQPDEQQKLQYRTVKDYLESGCIFHIWTEWEDVKTIIMHTSPSGDGSYREHSAQGVSSADLPGGISQAGLWKKPEKP